MVPTSRLRALTVISPHLCARIRTPAILATVRPRCQHSIGVNSRLPHALVLPLPQILKKTLLKTCHLGLTPRRVSATPAVHLSHGAAACLMRRPAGRQQTQHQQRIPPPPVRRQLQRVMRVLPGDPVWSLMGWLPVMGYPHRPGGQAHSLMLPVCMSVYG